MHPFIFSCVNISHIETIMFFSLLTIAGVQPRLIQGIRSGDGVGDLFIFIYSSKIQRVIE